MGTAARRIVVAALLAVPVIVLGGAAALVLTPAGDSPTARSADAVIALAGEEQRFHVADEMVASAGGLLVVSWIPGSEPERDERCRNGGDRILCFHPVPISTAGEARAIGRLATDQGWGHITVVTSRYHTARAELLVGQCVDGAQVDVVSATDRILVANVLQETLAVLGGMTVQRAC